MTGNEGAGEVHGVERADHHKHMDYVQAVIARLANNSFVMKGWALTLTTALLGFAVSRGQALLAVSALVPAIAFWLLDTYFLRQERAFRHLFADVASKRVTAFAMNPREYAAREKWWVVMRSASLSGFYAAIILVSLGVASILGIAQSNDAGAPEHEHSQHGSEHSATRDNSRTQTTQATP